MRSWLGKGVVIWILAAIGTRALLVPAEICPAPTAAELTGSIERARDWLLRNQLDDGRFVYEYDRRSDTLSDDYNLVRHAGVIMALTQLAAEGGDSTGLEAADRSLSFLTDQLIEANGGRAVGGSGRRVQAGTSALMLAGLTYRRAATTETVHDELITDLATFLAGQIGDDGRVLAYWDTATQSPVPEEVSPFFTGEVSWALARTHRILPDHGFDADVLAILDYLALRRNTVEPVFPPNDDHWAAYTLAEAGSWSPNPLSDEHLAYAHRLGGHWSTQTRFDSQRSGRGVSIITRGPKATGGVHGTGAEGLGALWRLAGVDERLADERNEIRDRLVCDASMLLDRQAAGPPLEDGAWFKDGVTRMDIQQHVMSGLIATLPALETAAASRDVPLTTRARDLFLTAGLFVVSIDPRRLVGRERTRRDDWSLLAAVGGTVLVAMTGPGLLASREVSITSWFFATGILLALAACWRLVVQEWAERIGPSPASTSTPPFGWSVLQPASCAVVALAAYRLGAADALGALALGAACLVAGRSILARAHWTRPLATVSLFGAGLLIIHGVVGLG